MKVWIAHAEGRELLGTVPAGVRVEVASSAAALPSDPSDVRFWVPPVDDAAHAPDWLPKLTGVEVVQLLSAGADKWVGRVPAGVTLCDARGAHDPGVSEWVLGATIGVLRRFPLFTQAQQRQDWAKPRLTPTSELTGKRVLLIGAGSIGAAVERAMAPFSVRMTKVARTARPGEGVHGVEELPGLLPHADVVVLLVPLTEETRGLVDAGFLAALPDGALLVNAARGPVVDTAALITEVASGRISAALDVTDPEPLPPGHPLWLMPNVFITPHMGGDVDGWLRRTYGLAGEQLRRFAGGQEPINQVRSGY